MMISTMATVVIMVVLDITATVAVVDMLVAVA
jgi:hypothetical protein